jgi:hypothetical protein
MPINMTTQPRGMNVKLLWRCRNFNWLSLFWGPMSKGPGNLSIFIKF